MHHCGEPTVSAPSEVAGIHDGRQTGLVFAKVPVGRQLLWWKWFAVSGVVQEARGDDIEVAHGEDERGLKVARPVRDVRALRFAWARLHGTLVLPGIR